MSYNHRDAFPMSVAPEGFLSEIGVTCNLRIKAEGIKNCYYLSINMMMNIVILRLPDPVPDIIWTFEELGF